MENEVAMMNNILLGAEIKDGFSVTSRTLNELNAIPNKIPFPGNISPEGYFYSPFNEVMLKELEDELNYATVRRINFVPQDASLNTITEKSYDPETGEEGEKTLYLIHITSPIPYKIIKYQPFVIYDISADTTNMGYLYSMEGLNITIATEYEIKGENLDGSVDGADGKSCYIISLVEESVPEYAEFIPATQKLVWRGPKKMSDLESTSPLYNMPFTNGRNYIHKNINVFVRRQDPNNDYNLFRPSNENPLRRFQVEGGEKLDFDQIQYITDTLINAC